MSVPARPEVISSMAATLLALNPSFILYPRAVLSFPALSSLLYYHFYSLLVFTALSTVGGGVRKMEQYLMF